MLKHNKFHKIFYKHWCIKMWIINNKMMRSNKKLTTQLLWKYCKKIYAFKIFFFYWENHYHDLIYTYNHKRCSLDITSNWMKMNEVSVETTIKVQGRKLYYVDVSFIREINKSSNFSKKRWTLLWIIYNDAFFGSCKV